MTFYTELDVAKIISSKLNLQYLDMMMLIYRIICLDTDTRVNAQIRPME